VLVCEPALGSAEEIFGSVIAVYNLSLPPGRNSVAGQAQG